MFIDANVIITGTIIFTINTFSVIKLFPRFSLPFTINTRINVSKLCSPKCFFFNHFDRRFICTKVHIHNELLSSYLDLFNLLIALLLLIFHVTHSTHIPYNQHLLCSVLQYFLIHRPSSIYHDRRCILLAHIYSLYLENTNNDKSCILLTCLIY